MLVGLYVKNVRSIGMGVNATSTSGAKSVFYRLSVMKRMMGIKIFGGLF